MDLRMVILAIGLVIIGVIWFDGRRRQQKTNRVNQFEETRMQVNTTPNHSFFSNTTHETDPLLMEDSMTVSDAPVATETPRDTLFAFRLLPKGPGQFSSKQIAETLVRFGLTFEEKRKIYHAVSEQESNAISFSVANAFEPGTLPSDANVPIAGLVFFTALFEQAQPPFVFERMLLTARRVADALGGDLYDAQHQLMTAQRVSYYRDRVMGTGS